MLIVSCCIVVLRALVGHCEVPYYRKFDIPGRRLAQRPSLQWMPREDKTTALSMDPPNSFQGGKVMRTT